MTKSQHNEFARARAETYRSQGLSRNEVGALAQVECLVYMVRTDDAFLRAEQIYSALPERVKMSDVGRVVGESIGTAANAAKRMAIDETNESTWYAQAEAVMELAIETGECVRSKSGNSVVFAQDQLGRRDLSGRIGFAQLQMKSAGLS